MRPEISDNVIERLRAWALKRRKNTIMFGLRGGSGYYSVEDALDDLLKEVGF